MKSKELAVQKIFRTLSTGLPRGGDAPPLPRTPSTPPNPVQGLSA